ncbi:hypothetical protein CR513_37990, partial [Mucuna pruriens]
MVKELYDSRNKLKLYVLFLRTIHLCNKVQWDSERVMGRFGLVPRIEEGENLKFLHGLIYEYDSICVQILGKQKLPSLSEVFSIMRSEETRQLVMLDKGNSNTRFTMVKGKVPQKDQSPNENHSQRVVMVNTVRIANDQDILISSFLDTCYKRYGKEKILE